MVSTPQPNQDFRVMHSDQYAGSDAQRNAELGKWKDPSRYPGFRRETPLWRVSASAVTALFAGAIAAAIWKTGPVLHWGAVIAALILGFLMVIPLRVGMVEWRRVWWVRILPANILFSLLVWFGVETPTDTASLFAAMAAALVGSLIVTQINVVELQHPSEFIETRVTPPDRPRDPSWPPDSWSQEQWDAWWQQFSIWNHYRSTQLNENVLSLDRPPTHHLIPGYALHPAQVQEWHDWYTEYLRWKSISLPMLAPEIVETGPSVDASDFPAGWDVQQGDGPFSCAICCRTRPLPIGVSVAICPGPAYCRQPICRACLKANNDKCPSCSYGV